MFAKIKSIVTIVSAWLMMPLGRVKAAKQRLIFRALRSRFFLLVSLLTAAPILAEALGATWKATFPSGQVTPWLLWLAAGLSWILFIITVLDERSRILHRLQEESPN